MKKQSVADKIIKKQTGTYIKEIASFFSEKKKDLSVFEESFLQKMAKEHHLTSVRFGIDTIIAYRKALIKRQSGITKPTQK